LFIIWFTLICSFLVVNSNDDDAANLETNTDDVNVVPPTEISAPIFVEEEEKASSDAMPSLVKDIIIEGK
jgi:hypothetical protein